MAATCIISIHINKGKTARQCIGDRLDYIMNPKKTDGGILVSTYACSPETAADEFMLFRQEYQTNTGRTQNNEVIGYHVRQAFKPDEITPEEANEIGKKLASRMTDDQFAYVVATHIDKHHIHNHIIICSTDLEGQHKYRDVKQSAKDLAEISDSLCREHSLSVIQNPQDKTVTYDKWQGNQRKFTTRQAAERYGVPVNRSGMACCPFHDDRHPSMKIDERFYCFGCHTTGDVIDFTAKLFDLSLYDAAKKLANDFNIQPLPPGQSTPIPKLPAAMIERKEEQRVLKILIEYERLLEKWKEEFAPSEPEDENWDDRFVHAVHHLPPLSDVIDRLFSSDPDERKVIMDHIRSTDAVAKIEEILNEGCQEVKNSGPEKDRAA